MSTHTPGPWQLDGNSIIAKWEDGTTVQLACMARTQWSYPDAGRNRRLALQNDANRHLIAAAPDLLAALKGAIKLPRPWLSAEPSLTFAEWEEAFSAIEAAIAKAEDRS